MSPRKQAKSEKKPVPRDQTESEHQREMIREIRQTPVAEWRRRMAEAAQDYENPESDIGFDLEIGILSATINNGAINATITVRGVVDRPDAQAVARGESQMIVIPAKVEKRMPDE